MTGLTLPKPFDGAEHQSFSWQAGDHAALLLHGFPGTPAEMRPLGKVLNDAGWTVHGLMLPGLGADIATLENRSFQDWLDAASQAMEELQLQHSLVILVGYSMGGALALRTALEKRPAGLVLLAPFWSFGEGWRRLLWPAFQLLLRHIKPLKRADFNTTEVRRALQRMYQSIDLDNPQIQHALRQTTVSLDSIAQVRQLGLSAFDRAAEIDVPTLVLQGNQDKVVRPTCTARLRKRLPNTVQYHELNAGHDLVDSRGSAWVDVKNRILTFADSIQGKNLLYSKSSVKDRAVSKKTC